MVGAEQGVVPVELRVPDPGDPDRDPGLGGGQEAGDHVRLVAVRDRDDHVGIGYLRAFQHLRTAAAPDNGLHVERLGDLLESLLVPVDDDGVDPLAREDVGDMISDLAGPDDDHFHFGITIDLSAE